MKFKAVLFDLGSTLIEYENMDWETLGKMGIATGYPHVKKIYPEVPDLDCFGESFYKYLREILDSRVNHTEIDLYNACTNVFNRMGLPIKDGMVKSFVEIYYQPVTKQVTLLPGAVDILDKIKKADMVIGLISNSIFPEEFHRKEMERFGLLEYFDFTIFSSTVGFRKPAKKIFELALKKADVEPSQAIFIGDRFDADAGGAKNTGIVAVLKYREGRENPDNIQPDYSIVNLDELESIIF